MTNKAVANPKHKDLLDLFMSQVLMTMNCHAVATVQSFDAEKQTLRAALAYQKTLNGKPVNYPVLVDCPAIILKGGPCALTFPIAAGDDCLILFNDRDMDGWYGGGGVQPVPTQRMHSFSDAIALVGLSSSANALLDYDTARAVLRHGQTMVGVGVSKVKVANGTTSLNTLMQAFIADLQTLNTALSTAFSAPTLAPGSPLSAAGAAACTAAVTALTTRATQIAGLLE